MNYSCNLKFRIQIRQQFERVCLYCQRIICQDLTNVSMHLNQLSRGLNKCLYFHKLLRVLDACHKDSDSHSSRSQMFTTNYILHLSLCNISLSTLFYFLLSVLLLIFSLIVSVSSTFLLLFSFRFAPIFYTKFFW